MDLIIILAGFAVAFAVSTFIIRRGVPALKAAQAKGAAGRRELLPDSTSTAVFDLKATGFWIGLCEMALIFALVFADALGALAIIIGAKEFVRKEKIQEDASYYLLGTLANLVIGLVAALISRWVTGSGA